MPDVDSTDWNEIEPQYPNYLFDPQNAELLEEYERGWKITEMFGFTGEGFKTHRDSFAIAPNKEEVQIRLRRLVEASESDERLQQVYGLRDTNTWKLAEARQFLRSDGKAREAVRSCLYRPFDNRFCLLHSSIMDRPRLTTQHHMLQSNLALSTTRSVEIQTGFEHIFCVDRVMDHHGVSLKEANYLFPLYLYPTNENLFDAAEEERRPNLSPEFVRDVSERLGLEFVADGRGDLARTFGPEDVFHYAYAVFHAPSYRERYAEFLKRDFPRLPLTSDRDLFAALAGKGEELVGLHLMRSSALDDFITRFPEPGDNVVEKVRYEAANERVRINAEQYFEGVTEEAWEFRVGGYQVLDKWLKDRKGRALTSADLRHYQRIVVALTETQRIMREIDETIPGWPLK